MRVLWDGRSWRGKLYLLSSPEIKSCRLQDLPKCSAESIREFIARQGQVLFPWVLECRARNHAGTQSSQTLWNVKNVSRHGSTRRFPLPMSELQDSESTVRAQGFLSYSAAAKAIPGRADTLASDMTCPPRRKSFSMNLSRSFLNRSYKSGSARQTSSRSRVAQLGCAPGR